MRTTTVQELLLAVAEDARQAHGVTRVQAVLDARMDEMYVQRYEFGSGRWQPLIAMR